MSSKKRDGFIMQAGIMAAAGIIVRIIGILYRSPLVAIIGDEGNGYYNTAYIIYTIILLVSSYSIPSAISKIIAARLAVHEYKNAQRIFYCAFLYVIVVGGAASLFCFFEADMLVGKNSAQVLQIFAPTIFFSGLLGVLRGYFQAHRTMLQTSVSQIVEQILNAAVSIGAAYLLMNLAAGSDTTTQAIRGAMGSALGTGSGVVIALIFMALVYHLNRRMIQKRVQNDQTQHLLSYREIFKITICMVTPVVLSTCIYNLSSPLNLKIYQGIMENAFSYTEAQATTAFGLFSGKAMQIVNIPIALASAMSAAIIPTIAGSFEKKNLKETNQKIARAIKVTMMISIPAAFGLFSLAKPVTMLLYPQKDSVDLVASLIRVLSITVIFYGLSTLSNAVLQGTGRVNVPVINAVIANIVQGGLLVVLLFDTKLDLYAVCIVTILYSFLMCLLNGIAVRRQLQYRQEVVRTFVLPIVASFWMALGAGGTYFGAYKLLSILLKEETVSYLNNAVSTVIAVGVAGIIYLVLILKLGVLSRKELTEIPKGTVLLRIGEKLHLL